MIVRNSATHWLKESMVSISSRLRWSFFYSKQQVKYLIHFRTILEQKDPKRMKIREKCLHFVKRDKRDSSVQFTHSLKVIKINLKLFNQLARTTNNFRRSLLFPQHAVEQAL